MAQKCTNAVKDNPSVDGYFCKSSMLKRFIARLLIFLQFYNGLFQGVAHANLVTHYPAIRDEIHLHTSPGKDGILRIALGTNRGGETGGGEELLDVIEVPSYDTLAKASRPLQLPQQVPPLPKTFPTDAGTAAAASLQPDQGQRAVSPKAALDPDSDPDPDADLDQDADHTLGTHPQALFSKSGVTRAPEGAHFNLQGLEIFVSNTGEALIQGKQTNFTKPIFLSSSKGVILKDVDASTLILSAPAILGVGHSTIDFLSLQGVTPAAVFINGGGLTAKEVFLKNLHTTNAKTIETVAIDAQGGTFNNTGHLEAETKIGLGADKFSNSGTVVTEVIQGLEGLKEFANTATGKITTDTTFKTGTQTTVINHGSIESKSGVYEVFGPALQQHGKITGKSLKLGKGTAFTTSASQALVLDEAFISDSTSPLALAGIVSVKTFDYAGPLDLAGTLRATFFKGRGTVQATGRLTIGKAHFTAAFSNLGGIDLQVLEAAAGLSISGPMRVRHTARVMGTLQVAAGGSLTGYDDAPLCLTLVGIAEVAGHVVVDDLDAVRSIQVSGSGQLLTKRKTVLAEGMVIAKDAASELHGLKIVAGDIINHGDLRVRRVDPTGALIRLINTGKAIIDDQQILPKIDDQSLENLARVATAEPPAGWDAHKDWHEFATHLPTIKTQGSLYLRLSKALKAKEPFVSKLGNEPEFARITQAAKAAELAIQYKQEFMQLYEGLLTKSQTEGSKVEQAELRKYLEQFASHYQQVFVKRKAYTKSLPPAIGAALLIENSGISNVKLQVVNQASGQLALQSGKFEFMGDTGFVNDGTLIQERSYLLWLTGAAGAFNRGTWRAKGSLGLLGYHGQDIGKVEVENALQVNVVMDALDALRGLQQVKTKKMHMHAPRVKDTAKADKVLPWVVKLHLFEDFESVGNIYTNGLQLFCRNFDVNGDLSAAIKDGAEVIDPEQGFLRVTATHNAKLGLSGYLYGRKAAAVKSRNLNIEGREQIPGASLTELVYPFANAQDSRIIYRRAQNGIYSLDGPVCLDFTEEFVNHFGSIRGTYFVINGKTFRNISGFMQGTDAARSSQIIADTILQKREELGKYRYGILGDHPDAPFSSQGYVRYSERFCETSPQAIIEHAGDLTLIYHTLANDISDITSGNRLILDARRSDQTLEVGDAGSRVQLEGDLARTANPPGVTVTWDRHGHTSLIRGKHSVTGTLGDATLSGGVHARSIALTAAQMTLLNLQLDQQQTASLVRLAQYMQASQSSMYRLIGDGSTYDTRFALSQSSRMYPRSIVSMTSVPCNMPLNLGATWRAFEFAFGQNFSYIYRGLEYLGLSFADLCEISAEEVRSRQGAQVHRHLITDGKDEREVDVVTHHELTSPQALGKAFMPMLFMEFGRNISRLETEADKAEEAKAAEERAKKLKEKSEELLKAAKAEEPQQQFDFSLFVPTQEIVHGLKGDGGRTDVKVTDGDFASLGATVSGHGGSIVVPRGSVKLLSQTQRVYTGHVLHPDESFQDVVPRAGVENYGTDADREFRIVSATGIEIEGAKLKAATADSLITMTTPGPIVDRALAVSRRQTTEIFGKSSYTKEVVDETTMSPTEYSGAGAVHMQSGSGVVLQAPDISCSMRVAAPSLALPDVINQRSVHSTTESHGGGFFGAQTKKKVVTTMQAFFSRGGKLKGPEFIATVQHFSATHIECDTRGTVTATERAELLAGRSSMVSHTKTESEGMIWKKVSIDAEKHLTHQPCTFRQPFTFHTPVLTMERVSGSGPAAHLHSDTPPQYTDLVDVHEHHHHSQKNLTSGAAMIVKLAMAVAAMYAAPLAGVLGSIPGAMVSAGVGTLCGDTSVCLIENDGDIGRTMRELGRRDVVKNVARSMLAAGLVQGITDLASTPATSTADAAARSGTEMASGASGAGSSTSVATVISPAVSSVATTGTVAQSAAGTLATKIASKTFEEYAKQAVIQSAVNTVLSVAMDGQDFAEALKHGIAMAGINTVASYCAGKIGDLYKVDATDRINAATHKALHLGLGAALGATTAVVTGQDVMRSALSGGVGGMLGETFAEVFDSKPLGDLLATTAAFAVGLDAVTAYSASHNATEHNYQAHHRLYLQQLGLDDDAVDVDDSAEEAIDTHDIDTMVPPPTPRTRDGLIAVRGFDQVERECPQLAETWKREGYTREIIFQDAYESAEVRVLIATAWKGLTGGELSAYERQVSAERGVVWAIGRTIDQAVFRGTPVVGKLCAKTFGKTLKQALAPAVKKVGFEFRSVSGKIHDTPISWTSPTGTGQTYKIWQRTDIDWRHVRTAGRDKFIGKTNAEAAHAGLAPQLPDGSFATIHHIGQDARGALVEASTSIHKLGGKKLPSGKTPFDVLHSQHGTRAPHPEFPVNHSVWSTEASAYWKFRIGAVE